MSSTKSNLHPGNAKRLSDSLNDFSLTMQHAIRGNLERDLLIRRAELADESPLGFNDFTALEMFDYLIDSDSDFYNWLFPYCAVVLTPENLSHLHLYLVKEARKTLAPVEDAELVNSN